MRAHFILPTAIALLAGLLVLDCGGGLRADTPLPVLAGPVPTKSSARGWALRQTPVVDIVKSVKGAVVNIHSERTARGPASLDEMFTAKAPRPSHDSDTSMANNRVSGMGTGIVIDPRGYIVTNQHVVEDVSALRVRLADGTVLPARIMARDPESDLAILKITPPRPLPVLPIGTAKDAQVGETVIAIGNAYGYDHTVTVGVISAIGRDVALNKDIRYKSLIQTDASINPGNSGGPLINLDGELVGVNVAIRAGAQGIGFAIPADTMVTVASALLARERIRSGTQPLGMALQDEVTSGSASRRVVVDQVEDGPAYRAGLRKGDVLVKAGDVSVVSSLDLQRALIDQEAGRAVELLVRREGAESRMSLTLEAGQRSESRASPVSERSAAGEEGAASKVWRRLGVRVQTLNSSAVVTRVHPQLNGGMYVADVREGGPAARSGMRTGDILVGLHLWEMLSQENLTFVLDHPDRKSFTPLQYYILRSNQIHRGWVRPLE